MRLDISGTSRAGTHLRNGAADFEGVENDLLWGGAHAAYWIQRDSEILILSSAQSDCDAHGHFRARERFSSARTRASTVRPKDPGNCY